MLFERDGWKLEIDEEKTRAYYASLPVSDTQESRNFQRYVDMMCPADREIFDALCVDPVKLNVEGAQYVSTYLRRSLYWSGWADVYVFGTMLEAPPMDIVTLDDVAAQGIEILEDREDAAVSCGALEFDIQHPAFWKPDEDVPEGALYISLTINEIDWYLEEKCTHIDKEGFSVFDEIKWGLHRLFIGRREERKENDETAKGIISYMADLGITLTPMAHSEMKAYKKEWVNHYTDDPKIAKAALPAHRMHNLLWHVFSFEEDKALEGDAAAAAYDACTRGAAVLYVDDVDTAFRADDVSALTAETIETMCEALEAKYMDIVITAADFSWTYCRTHEKGWMGPYYYEK